MSRYALILSAGILAVISVACVATAPSPAPQFPPVPHPGPRLLGSRATFVPAVLTVNPTCSDADDFVRRIKVLKAGYDPNPTTGPYNPPDTQTPPAGAPPNNPYNLRQEIVDDLKAAYNNAPRLFKDQLCQLDGIYLNP